MEEFIPGYNRKFAHSSRERGSAYRPLSKDLDLNNIFCIKEERTVAPDNTISYKARTFQILPDEYRISFVKTKVMVHEHLDGSIHIFYKGRELKHKQIPKKRTNKKDGQLTAVNY